MTPSSIFEPTVKTNSDEGQSQKAAYLQVSGLVGSFFNLARSNWTVGAENVQSAMSKEEISSIRSKLILEFPRRGGKRMPRGGIFDGES